MKITRRFTKAGQDPFATVEYEKRTSRITNPDGSVVFEMNDAEIPRQWSQLATDIMVSKYFRKAGVPQLDENGQPQRDAAGNILTGPEKSARQVINRLAGCWRYWGEKHSYFDTPDDAQAFYDELAYMLLHQMCRAQQPPVVQHRPELRLRHHRPRPGTLLLRSPQRRTAQEQRRLLPPPAPRLLHPVHQ